MKKGRILFLNGPSSAGKTTLSWELQTHAPGYWYWLPFDYFLDTVPSQLWDNDESEGFRTAYDLHHDCVKLMSDQGKDIIVDTVMYSKESFLSFITKFAEYPVIMIKAICPVEELSRREQARGDRDIGLAVSQLKHMELQTNYDLIVDTHAQSSEACARSIIELLTNPKKHLASFALLKENPAQWMNPLK
ncbi:MAG: chloramphenicol phosphotransferase CPT family protein [Defluviitaleaceae bacterium]|nr:chloramphenicol phosphotransferase CPT family protein [Defluviitaleaceae bacterium]